MALILVAEQESRYIERIHDALTSEGWQVHVVGGEQEAMDAAAARAPHLVLVSSELEGAENLFHAFSRKRGGPGVVALLSEVGGQGSEDADDQVSKPFTDQDLRLAVRRGLKPTPQSQPVPTPVASAQGQLTSEDIFGDLVAEVESEFTAAEGGKAAPSAPSSPVAEPASGDPAAQRSRELDRALEETLSGLQRTDTPRKRTKSSRKRHDDDVDALLSETLGGLALSRGKSKKRDDSAAVRPSTPAPRPSARDSDEIDLSELEELARPQAKRPSRTEPREPLTTPVPGPEQTPSSAAPEERQTIETIDLGLDLELDLESVPTPPEALAATDGQDVPAERAPEETAEKGEVAGVFRFGQYTLLERIAVGGMAEVWKARMTGVEGFQKTVAIKKILPHLTDNEDFVNMFIDEAKLAAQLNHPNIIHIYDLGKIGEHYYIAMEYVAGQNLRTLLNESQGKRRPIPVGLGLLIGARLASALDYAHRKRDFDDRELGLVHRDVSPQNVLLSSEGDIKLCDFGIVKAVSKASQTQMGALKGKLQYMSPEQAWGKAVDARSDIFSLGVLLFEMLTGQRLFTGDSEISILEAVRQCRVRAPREVNPSIPPEVEEVILHALEQDPEERFQTAGHMQQELEKLLYAMRPTPGQTDLGEFLHQLSRAERVEEVVQPESASEAPVAEPEAAAPRPEEVLVVPAENGTEPPARETRKLRQTTAASAPAAGGAEVIPAVAEAEVEIEEGGSRGKKALLVAIVILVLAGAAAAYYVWSQRTRQASVAEEPAATEPASPEDLGGSGQTGGETGDGGVGEETGDDGEGSGSQEEGQREEGAAEPIAATPSLLREEPVPATPPAPLRSAASARSEEQPVRRPRGGEETPSVARGSRGTGAPAGSAAAEPTTARSRTTEPRPLPARGPEPAVEATARPTVATPPPRPATEPATPRPTAATAEAPAAARDEPNPGVASEETTSGEGARAAPETATAEPSEQPAPPRSAPQQQEPAREIRKPKEPEPRPATARSPPPAPSEPKVREGDLVGPGPGVVAPVLVSISKPKYPPIARRMRVEGEVVLSLLVDETGDVAEVRVTQGVRQSVGLNEAAEQAARTARFEPATKDGLRVKMWTVLRIPFKL